MVNMDSFSIIWELLQKILGTETLILIIVTGYCIFFLLFYGTRHWGRNSLEWADRILLSIPIGFLFWLSSLFPTTFIFNLLKELQLTPDRGIIEFLYFTAYIACLTRYRVTIGMPLASKKALCEIINCAFKRSFSWAYIPIVPLLIFGYGFGNTNTFTATSSKQLWFFVFPLLFFCSVYTIELFFALVVVLIPLIIHRKIAEVEDVFLYRLLSPSCFITLICGLFRLWHSFFNGHIDEFVKNLISKPLMAVKFMSRLISFSKAQILVLIVLFSFLVVLTDSIFVVVTPQVVSIEIKRTNGFDVVIKPPHSDESYLIRKTYVYTVILPRIPLMNLTIVNPSNYSLRVGSVLTYETAAVEFERDHLFLTYYLDKNLNKTKMEIEPRWTNNKITRVKLTFYDRIAHPKVIKFLNKTTVKADKEYNYFFLLETSRDDTLIDEYYLLPPLSFTEYDLKAYLDGKNVTWRVYPQNDWIVIHNLRVYKKGIHMLVINVRGGIEV